MTKPKNMTNLPRVPKASSSSSSSSPSSSSTAALRRAVSPTPVTMTQRTRGKMAASFLPYVLTATLVLLCAAPVHCQSECTRLVSYSTVKPYVERSMCNVSYTESCGFWTYAECTRY
ncbi:hypothetical protein EGW08_006500 [Elysia chlorotica]|uniref:Uncharacterized protein n=1 Tax=Elysia chlorotica TaxID=188477 RepID=A0A3S1BK74_ELYCH|nr:hypothetical protein EGW08_006500 [Elysia chlorotica]